VARGAVALIRKSEAQFSSRGPDDRGLKGRRGDTTRTDPAGAGRNPTRRGNEQDGTRQPLSGIEGTTVRSTRVDSRPYVGVQAGVSALTDSPGLRTSPGTPRSRLRPIAREGSPSCAIAGHGGSSKRSTFGSKPTFIAIELFQLVPVRWLVWRAPTPGRPLWASSAGLRLDMPLYRT
jgi:hypothetical protein